MFIPPVVHHPRGRSRRAQRPQPPNAARVLGAIAAIAATGMGALVTAVLQDGGQNDTGDRTAIAILVVAAAVVGGFILARVIGRRGRI